VVTGNPVYPLFASFIETRDWSIEHAEIFSRYMRYYSWGIASGAQLSEGMRKALVMVTALLIVGAAGFFALLTRDITLRIMLLLTTIYTVLCVLLTGLLFRYWLFGIACFTLVGAIVFDQVMSQAGRRRAVALVLISIAFLVQINGERRQPQRFINDLSIAMGVRTPEQVNAGSLWQFWGKVRDLTPADAKILVAAFYTTFGASTFGCFPIDRQCFATDSHLQQYIRLDTWPAFLNSVNHAIDADAIVENTSAATHDKFAISNGLPRETNSRSKVAQGDPVPRGELSIKLPHTGRNGTMTTLGDRPAVVVVGYYISGECFRVREVLEARRYRHRLEIAGPEIR